MQPRHLILTLLLPLLAGSCKKWSDPQPVQDPRINEQKYCNDPEAVNYNWNFPGQPDNTICIFPSDLYKGTWLFRDSIYNAGEEFDSARSQLPPYLLTITPVGKSRLRITGFCGGTDSLHFTAERSTWQAYADTTIALSDTTFAFGQFLCRQADTLTGFLLRDRNSDSFLTIDFRVLSDTGLNFHRGTAVKQ